MNLFPIIKKHKKDDNLIEKRKEYQAKSLLNFYLSLISFYDFTKKNALSLIAEIYYLLTKRVGSTNTLFTLTSFLNRVSIINFYLYNSFSFTKSSIFLNILKKMKKYNENYFSLASKTYKLEKNYKKMKSIYSLYMLLETTELKRERPLSKTIPLVRITVLKKLLNKNLQKILETEIQNSLNISLEKLLRNYTF